MRHPHPRERRLCCWLALACSLPSVLACSPSEPPSPWRPLAAIADGPRMEAGVVASGGRIFVIGGYRGGLHLTGDVSVYDPADDVWRAAAPLPRPLHHLNVATVHENIYVLGAFDGEFSAVGETYAYDPGANAWRNVQPMPAGTERAAAATAALGNRIFVAGGSNQEATATASIYDADTDEWSSLPDLPAPRYHAVGLANAGQFFVVGGFAPDGSTPLRDLLVWAPAAQSWRASAAMLVASAGCAAGVIEGRIYCAGGEGDPHQGLSALAVVQVYDPTADAWSLADPMRTPRVGTAAAVVGGELFVPGGARIAAFIPVDVNEALHP